VSAAFGRKVLPARTAPATTLSTLALLAWFCAIVETDDHGIRLTARHLTVANGGGELAEPLLIDSPREMILARASTGSSFLKARHQFDEVAGPKPIIELMMQDVVPSVLAGAG
jgi:hypothetical protein